MNHQTSKGHIVYLFPGQGTQYVSMAKDFYQEFPLARQTFEEADDILQESLSSLIFNGPEADLTQTKNSQTAIYVVGIAILRVVEDLFGIQPSICAGLSLGEYTALTAAGWIAFDKALPVVRLRGEFMNRACENNRGTMAAVLGLGAEEIDRVVEKVNLPNELWVANYNCPGQVVISGTIRGVDAGIKAVQFAGAKRAIPLDVHGAFHSGLMRGAQDTLHTFINEMPMKVGHARIVMNSPGDFVSTCESARHHLVEQVTQSVRWQQEIEAIEKEKVDYYLAFGPGNTLSAMNKRMGVQAKTLSIEKVADLDNFKSYAI